MGAKQRDLSIPWVLSPCHVDLNNDTGLLKLVAMLAMLMDHAGKILFPGAEFMQIIGRMAFPIYAYGLAAGCVRTRDPLRYLGRILTLALISQPIYAVAMRHTVPAMSAISFAERPFEACVNFYLKSWTGKPSILATLALGLVLLECLRERRIACALSMLLLIYLLRNKLDYGMYGIGLIVLFYVFIEHRWVSLPLVAAYMIWYGLSQRGFNLFGLKCGIQLCAVLALPLIYSHTHTRIHIPKWLGYGFYPAHLVLIYLLDHFVF